MAPMYNDSFLNIGVYISYSFTLGVVGVAHGAKVGRLPVPCQAAETCRQRVQQTSAHGDKIDRCRIICAYLAPPRCYGVHIYPTLRARGAKLGTPRADCTL